MSLWLPRSHLSDCFSILPGAGSCMSHCPAWSFLPFMLHVVPTAVWPLCVLCAKSLQLCPTLGNPVASTPRGSSVHGVSQARILEWVAISFSRDLPNPGIEPASVSCIGSLSPASLGKPFFYKCFSNLYLHMCMRAYIHVFQICNNLLG